MTDWRKHVMQMLSPEQPAGLIPATVGEAVVQASFSGPERLLPEFDAAELLPQRAQDFLKKMRLRRDDAFAVTVPFFDIQQATTERTQAEQRLRQLQAHPQDHGFGLLASDVRVVSQQRLVDKLTADLRQLQERAADRSALSQAASGALTNVEGWLKTGVPGGTVLEDYEGEPPKLLKNESLMDAIPRVQRRGRELKADLHRIRSAPYPSMHAKAQMRQLIEARAMQSAPSTALLVEHDRREIAWAMQSVTSEVHAKPRALAFTEMPDVLGLICWLHKDAMIAALARVIDAEADDKAALSHEAREKAEAEVLSDQLAVERDESFFCWLAQSQGLPVEHRADINPVALLGLRLVTAPRADVPATSAGLSWNLIGGGPR